MSFVVAIDGPAGAGKGTIAKLVSKELNLLNIDTGATYRCVTLAFLRQGINIYNKEEVSKALENINIEIKIKDNNQRFYLNGEDVSEEIRNVEVNSNVSPISGIVEVRYKMVELQRKLSKGHDVIMEGRDIGTYVFPNADIKIYLDADINQRAKRRYIENLEKGIKMSFEEVLKNINDRDIRDSDPNIKVIGALKKANDAIIIDSTNMTENEVKDKIVDIIKQKRGN